MRYERDSALDQVRVVLGGELDPRKFSVLCLLGRDDIGQEAGSCKEPATTKGVEDIEYR